MFLFSFRFACVIRHFAGYKLKLLPQAVLSAVQILVVCPAATAGNFGFRVENKNAPSRLAWGMVKIPGFSQRRDRRSTEHF
jgi:hypothetical protein